jgi:hypothetical protein
MNYLCMHAGFIDNPEGPSFELKKIGKGIENIEKNYVKPIINNALDLGADVTDVNVSPVNIYMNH